MKQLKLSILFFCILLLTSCGGYMLEAGLSNDSGTLNQSEGSNGGTGGVINFRYKRMLLNHESGQHGLGAEVMFHINGYSQSDGFLINSISGRYYHLLDPNYPVKVYLTGSFGFGGYNGGRDGDQRLALLGGSMDFHFFKREFIYFSTKANYARNISNFKEGGKNLSFQIMLGVMLPFGNNQK